MMATDKEGCVHSLSQQLLSFYFLHTLYFNSRSWHLRWSGKAKGIPSPFLFPRGGGLINAVWLNWMYLLSLRRVVTTKTGMYLSVS